MDETRPNKTFLPHTNARFLKTFDELLRTIPPTPHLHYFVAQSSWKIIMDHLARTRNCSHRHCRAPYVGMTRDHNQNQSYVVPMHPLPGCGKKKTYPSLSRAIPGAVRESVRGPRAAQLPFRAEETPRTRLQEGNICQKSVPKS